MTGINRNRWRRRRKEREPFLGVCLERVLNTWSGWGGVTVITSPTKSQGIILRSRCRTVLDEMEVYIPWSFILLYTLCLFSFDREIEIGSRCTARQCLKLTAKSPLLCVLRIEQDRLPLKVNEEPQGGTHRRSDGFNPIRSWASLPWRMGVDFEVCAIRRMEEKVLWPRVPSTKQYIVYNIFHYP